MVYTIRVGTEVREISFTVLLTESVIAVTNFSRDTFLDSIAQHFSRGVFQKISNLMFLTAQDGSSRSQGRRCGRLRC